MKQIDFKKLDYLQCGTQRQQEVYNVLSSNRIMELLQPFDPILAGTYPLNIDIATSDLDILCYCPDLKLFSAYVAQCFGPFENFALDHFQTPQGQATTVSFRAAGFSIEVFGQSIPTAEQLAYKHMLVEYRILQENGDDFRQQIIDLKNKGMKTEPAFAHLLGLTGDPYMALLELYAPA